MPRITGFMRAERQSGTPQPTEVVCKWKAFGAAGGTWLQLDTYGSDDREYPEKLSQTLQLDRESALHLIGIIREAFEVGE